MTPLPSARAADLSPLPPRGRTFIAGFESTYLPAHDVDLLEVTGHQDRWQEDLAEVLGSGVRHLRYPVRWQHVHREAGSFDWAGTDRVLGHLHDTGAVPIVDLVHHTTYPRWLSNGFRGPDFRGAYLRYVEAFASRYSWIPAYTLFNEPFATLFLAGHEGLWPPYGRGIRQFTGLLTTVLPALSEAFRIADDLWPRAHHVWVDTAEQHEGVGSGAAYAAVANDRRHAVLDVLLGHDVDPDRPFLASLVEAGGEALLDLDPLRVDVLGLDYYCHSEWFYDDEGAHSPSPRPVGLAALVELYGSRYGLPMMLTETNIRGFPTDRVVWLKHTLEQYELALARGAQLHGYCWFPQVDSCDWDSLLARGVGRIDPVGVFSLDADKRRLPTLFTAAWRAAATGVPAADLPAYRLQQPCADQIAGWQPEMAHWDLLDVQETPPPRQMDLPPSALPKDPFMSRSRNSRADATVGRSLATDADLVVLSHLRWEWVWQRPQHLVSRITALRSATGSRTFVVEEPVVGDVAEAHLDVRDLDGITRVCLVVPGQPGEPAIGFTDPRARCYGDLVADLLARMGRPPRPDVWLYTPLAFEIAQSLNAARLIYDVMDDLASFHGAAPGMVMGHRRALNEADLVFTGGRSLDRGVRTHRQHDVHLFPSGVDQAHYASSRNLRTPRPRKVAGYVGVIDERLDLGLVAGLAAALPDWTIEMVGPVAKIDPADLPVAENLRYPGFTAYEQLPAVMAGFDVALMPFALNEATRSISPTKTLEYLAAGLPVVSTPVPDVVADYADVVSLASDAAAFAQACRDAAAGLHGGRRAGITAVLNRQEWDSIAAAMHELVDEVRARPSAGQRRDAVAGRAVAQDEASA